MGPTGGVPAQYCCNAADPEATVRATASSRKRCDAVVLRSNIGGPGDRLGSPDPRSGCGAGHGAAIPS
jgi:hypothetical protein